MAMFSNDVRVVNTATPAFLTEPNVTQYGWTKSEAAHYNQLIQYVDEARQIYEYISEKVIYFDGVLGKLEGIENVIDFMVQKANEVAEDAREVRTTASYITGVNTQIEIMYRNFNADYSIFNYKYADFTVQYADVLEKAYATQLNSEKAEKAYLDTKDLYDDLKSGQVYRGTWNPEVSSDYPDGAGTNSTWDVVLNFGTTSFVAQGKTWRSGDRLIYALETTTYYQINTGSGVDSINGKTGSVTLDAADVKAAPEGFGLGTFGKALLTTSCDDALDSGFYSINSDTTETPYSKGPSGATMISTKWGTGAGASQIFFNYTSDRVHFRRRQNGAWNSWREIYHTGKLPTAAEIKAVGLTGHQIMNDSLTASQFKASNNYAFLSSIRERQGMFLGAGDTDRRTIIGGGGDVPGDKTGVVLIRPNGITDTNGVTSFNADGTIANAAAPAHVSHLTNKKYVDDKVNAETTGGLLMRVGGPRDQEIDVALAGATGGAYVSETAPANPFQGARWFDTNEGRTFLWYEDGDSAQWVEENPQSADVMDGSPRLIKLADEGILEVALNKKSAIIVNNGSSISYQDQAATVFHNNAEGNGLEWSHGLLGENTLMTLAADGGLYTEGRIYARNGINLTGKLEMAAGNITSVAPNIMSINATEYNFVNARKGSHLCANAYWDGTNWLKNDASKPSIHAVVDVNGEFKVFASAATATSSTQLRPLNMDIHGNAIFTGEVRSGRSLVSGDTYAGVELLIPGKHASMMFTDSVGGNMRFVQSNGAGTELTPYANFHQTALTFYKPSNFQGLVQSTSGFRVNSISPVVELHSPGVAAFAWYIQGNGTIALGQTNGAGAVAKNIVVIDTTGNMVLPSATLYYDGSLTGTIWGGPLSAWCRANFAPISDEKLKRNIQPATKSALDNVSKIKFHSYDWVDGKTKSTNIGMVAQELEAIDPCYAHDIETFKEDGSVDTSVKALDTANLLSLALKSIQELEARIKELEEKVNG